LRLLVIDGRSWPMSDDAPVGYKRDISGVSAKAERRLLNAIAARLPAWVTPNQLTALGVAGGAATGLGYAAGGLSRYWLLLAIAGYVIHWFGDSLDGTTARVRKIERPRFGMFLDQSCDLLTVALILIGLGLSPWVRVDVALATYAGYLLLAVLVHLRAGVTGVYDIAHDGIGPTEGRLLFIALTLGMMFADPSGLQRWGGFSAFDIILLVMTFWSALTCVRQVVTVARRLAAEEPPGGKSGGA
jgi:phosphatidylglycerophosphate synthase